MKKLNEKRNRTLAIMSIVVLTIMAGFCLIGDVSTGLTALAITPLVIGTVTLSEKETEMFTNLKEHITTLVNKESEGHISEKAMTDKVTALITEAMKDLKENGELKKLTDALADLGLKLKGLQENPMGEDARKTIQTEIEKSIKDNPEKWKAFKNGTAQNFVMELKVAGTMLMSDHVTNGPLTAGAWEPGVIQIARNEPKIIPVTNYATTTSDTIYWVEKANPDGNADWTLEGGVKPLVDFDFVKKSSSAKKVTGKIKLSTEMLEDVPFMSAEINNELLVVVNLKSDDGVLTGDGIAENIKGIMEYSGAYVLATVKVATPNNYDCIVAGATQVKSLNFIPTHVFLNPIDSANLNLSKGTNGHYIFPPFVTPNGQVINGLTVIETNQMTVGTFLVGDMTKSKVRDYKGFTVTMGWVNDDFEKNLVTVLGERRLHHFIADLDTGAFVDDTFTNVKNAINEA
jgi:HK97 family phage major capsid protein